MILCLPVRTRSDIIVHMHLHPRIYTDMHAHSHGQVCGHDRHGVGASKNAENSTKHGHPQTALELSARVHLDDLVNMFTIFRGLRLLGVWCLYSLHNTATYPNLYRLFWLRSTLPSTFILASTPSYLLSSHSHYPTSFCRRPTMRHLVDLNSIQSFL